MNLLNAATPNKKRVKVELTIPQKWEIIEYAKKYPKASQKSLILKFNKDFCTTIPTCTMSDILKEDNIRKLEKLENVDDFNKRIREAKYPELEKCLYLWHCEQIRAHVPVSDDMLKDESVSFGNMLGLITFKYSSGWYKDLRKDFQLKNFQFTLSIV